MLKIEQQADLSAKRESLKKLSLLCHSISGLPNVYTIFIYRKRTPFSEKRPYYWLGYGLRWLCGTTIPFVMRVCDYIPLMSPVSWVKKWISNARFAGKRHFFDKLCIRLRRIILILSAFTNGTPRHTARENKQGRLFHPRSGGT